MEEKLAIITGATSGLGLSYANILAKRGWDLFLTGRRLEVLSKIKKRIENEENVDVIISKIDFTDEQQLDSLLESVKKLDRVDMLVNNAGYGRRTDFFQDDFVSQHAMLNVHVNAVTKLIHTVVPKMIKENRGLIINVSSLSAFIPTPLSFFYTSTKAFIVSFSECLHVDLLHTNIKVQVLCPGYINTNFHSRMDIETSKDKFFRRWFWMSPDSVVESSLNAILRHKHKVIYIPGWNNKVAHKIMKYLPKSFFYWILSEQSKLGHTSKNTLA